MYIPWNANDGDRQMSFGAIDVTTLLQREMPIPPHALVAIAALVLGATQLLMRKGTTRHKLIGYAWVGAMAFVAISGFFIHQIQLIGPFSPIHLLSFLVLYSLWTSIRAVRAGRIDDHRRTMRNLYVFGLVLTGLLTFLPGRTMHAVITGG